MKVRRHWFWALCLTLSCDATSARQTRSVAAAQTEDAQAKAQPCNCGPPLPIPGPRVCDDGSSEQVEISCRAVEAGGCAWHVARSGCPMRCAPEACGPAPAEASARCANAITPLFSASCLSRQSGPCAWELTAQDCAQRPPCATSQQCEADQYCDETQRCALRPATCAPVKERAAGACAVDGARYPSACHAAQAGAALSDDEARCAAWDEARMPPTPDEAPPRKKIRRGKPCADQARCGAPPPVAPPRRCRDGREEQVEVVCERRGPASCAWQIYREECA